MALDEALFEAVGNGTSGPILRLYRWQPATVTLGYAQRDEHAINFQVCRESGIDVVRRSTGGRAVFHHHEVTYAVIAPLDDPLFAGGILDSYRVIAEPLQCMLTELGVRAELVPARRSGERSASHDICFAAPASYELAVDGYKIAGSAQKRNDRVFLQHGSIPIDLDLLLMSKVLGKPGADNLEAMCRYLSQKVGWVNRYLESSVSLDQVEQAMASAFQKCIPGDWQLSVPSDEEMARAKRLHDERFFYAAWTTRTLGTVPIDPLR